MCFKKELCPETLLPNHFCMNVGDWNTRPSFPFWVLQPWTLFRTPSFRNGCKDSFIDFGLQMKKIVWSENELTGKSCLKGAARWGKKIRNCRPCITCFAHWNHNSLRLVLLFMFQDDLGVLLFLEDESTYCFWID
jgi:hypothetical protein